jgi:flagellar hook-associated protein 1
MSIPTLQGLQTALSGLIAEQTALDTTGNNIANANTEGYSRETALLEPNQALPVPAISSYTGKGAQLGTGVTVATIARIRNTYLDAQYRTQNSALSGAKTQAEILALAQTAFNEPSTAGIATQLSNFWTAWSKLAQAPGNEAAEQGVVAAGEQLARAFNELSTQLTTVSTQVGEQYNSLTGPSGEVEDFANQLAQLNGQIKLAEEAGQPPNNLLDRRDLLLDKLSTLANVTVTEQPDHTDTVMLGDAAKPLVEGTTVNWPQELTEAAGGELGALLNLTGPKGQLTALRTSLDEVAATLATTVNAPLAKQFFSGETAATIAVVRGGAAEQGYAALVENVGSDVRAAKDDQENLQGTLTAISDLRQGVSGVSLDEEMTNLITFQRGYQASARTLTAMDSMLETLIEHTGVVGL